MANKYGEGATIIIAVVKSKNVKQVFEEAGIKTVYASYFHQVRIEDPHAREALSRKPINIKEFNLFLANFMYFMETSVEDYVDIEEHPEREESYETLSHILEHNPSEDIIVLYNEKEIYS